jgi:hypothetical protein
MAPFVSARGGAIALSVSYTPSGRRVPEGVQDYADLVQWGTVWSSGHDVKTLVILEEGCDA